MILNSGSRYDGDGCDDGLILSVVGDYKFFATNAGASATCSRGGGGGGCG